MLGLLWQKFGTTVEFPGATGNVVLIKQLSWQQRVWNSTCRWCWLLLVRRQRKVILTQLDNPNIQAHSLDLITILLLRKEKRSKGRKKEIAISSSHRGSTLSVAFSDYHSIPSSFFLALSV